MKDKIIKRLKEFTEDLEKGDLSKYKKTKIIKNDDGTYTCIESHKGKIKRHERKIS